MKNWQAVFTYNSKVTEMSFWDLERKYLIGWQKNVCNVSQ